MLAQLAEQQQRALDRLNIVIDSYAGPLSANSAVLSFPQHMALFANVQSLRDAHQVVVAKYQAMMRTGTTPPPLNNLESSSITLVQHMAAEAAAETTRLTQVVRNVFCDLSMTLFMAEHMMYVINYARTIAPSLLGIMNSKETRSQLAAFVAFAEKTSSSLTVTDTLLPEHDPLRADPQHVRSPVEELLVMLAAPLPSLLHYIYAARAIMETEAASRMEPEDQEKLVTFAESASRRQAEETSMTLDWITTHNVTTALSRMEGVELPANDRRALVHVGHLTKKFQRGKHERLAFLFTDLLMYCEELTDDRLRVRGNIPLLGVTPRPEIVDIEDSPFQQLRNAFELRTGAKTYDFSTSSAHEKRRWIAAIQQVLDAASVPPNEVGRELPGVAEIITAANTKCGAHSRLERDRCRMQSVKFQRTHVHVRGGSGAAGSGGSQHSEPIFTPRDPALSGVNSAHERDMKHFQSLRQSVDLSSVSKGFTSSAHVRQLSKDATEYSTTTPISTGVPAIAPQGPQPTSNAAAVTDDKGLLGDSDSDDAVNAADPQ